MLPPWTFGGSGYKEVQGSKNGLGPLLLLLCSLPYLSLQGSRGVEIVRKKVDQFAPMSASAEDEAWRRTQLN